LNLTRSFLGQSAHGMCFQGLYLTADLLGHIITRLVFHPVNMTSFFSGSFEFKFLKPSMSSWQSIWSPLYTENGRKKKLTIFYLLTFYQRNITHVNYHLLQNHSSWKIDTTIIYVTKKFFGVNLEIPKSCSRPLRWKYKTFLQEISGKMYDFHGLQNSVLMWVLCILNYRFSAFSVKISANGFGGSWWMANAIMRKNNKAGELIL